MLVCFLLLCYCQRRQRRRGGYYYDSDSDRGEYRRVTSRFTADAFDDALDEDDLDDGYGEEQEEDGDEESNNGVVYSNGAKNIVVEMSTLDKGRLSLEEMNG